jgi:adenylate cyclase
MHVLLRGDTLQRLRLVSGLVLFAFAATHFINHALGLVSIDMMQVVQQWRWTVTRSWPGTIVLLAALLTHASLGLYKLAGRTNLRLPRWELLQVALGISIPFLLLPHIINTRIAHVYFGVNDIYVYELARLWPVSAITQSLLLVIVWVHGCIGIHFWLRLYQPYRRVFPILLTIAVIIPLAALGGFFVGGSNVAAAIEIPSVFANLKVLTHWPSAATAETLGWLRNLAKIEFAAVLAVVAGCIGWTYFARLAGPKVTIAYTSGPTIKVPQGPTLLEISRMARVPHASVCGGRARCSTCRVRIERGSFALPAPVFPEIVTLGSIGAPPNVRLACQIRPEHYLIVTRLLKSESTGPEAAELEEADSAGVEKTLAVMFVDLRDFTRLSEKRLPFDIVYVLNEFFGVVGAAITAHGGWIDKFLGDGLLAVFGQRDGVEAGCRQALRTARDIDLALDHINAKLEAELGRPLAVGIGIDAGPLLVGRIGYGESVDFTVIGNPVNVASRLEALTKEKDVQLILSREVALKAGWEPPPELIMQVEVRGVAAPIEVIGITRGRDIAADAVAPTEDEKEKPAAWTAGLWGRSSGAPRVP